MTKMIIEKNLLSKHFERPTKLKKIHGQLLKWFTVWIKKYCKIIYKVGIKNQFIDIWKRVWKLYFASNRRFFIFFFYFQIYRHTCN